MLENIQKTDVVKHSNLRFTVEDGATVRNIESNSTESGFDGLDGRPPATWATTKLTPSLAARLGPEVNHTEEVSPSHSHNHHNSHEPISESPTYERKPSRKSSETPKSGKRGHAKENRVVEILDSDQEEGEAQEEEPGIEVINIDDDDVQEAAPSRRRKERSKTGKRQRREDPDVTIVEEKSHGPTPVKRSEKDNRKRGSPHR